MSGVELTQAEKRTFDRTQRKARRTALLFVAPLLLFIVVSFVLPIGTMLFRSVYHPAVAELIPATLQKLKAWDETSNTIPEPDALQVFAGELKTLVENKTFGKLAEEINRSSPGASSLIKSTARKMSRLDDAELQSKGDQALLDAGKQWSNPNLWRSIKKAGNVFTGAYYLTAVDMERNGEGRVVSRKTQIYTDLYVKSLKIALYITLLTGLIGFPLAYYLANAPERTANVLMVFVLLPFWTSLLVRTTAWMALLQTNGVINSVLQSLHIISEPLELLYTQFSTIIAMTHILLPFMILPLYSVMKGIDPSYFRAALSLGAKPIPAFMRIYLPMTTPGFSAGALLVFIISIGYYITPALVGGVDGQMISNLIAFHMQSSNNWELAAALGSLLLVLILAMYWLYDRLVGVSNLKLG
ncbi:ABC transporter permease [Gynuella sunshinyii]|uniref:ABC-type spermidine/putrescine transport system, permease component I n=1 Tax=Gynuella sunshinyii YC6258 TaxID=1445510 RepID=A0A0C5VU18_9GAMM|nr:ABC transporter permease [Gynuella sunshinyii]AJQ93864.1 ABC-type spermidine/putrescine transport system, permease component I [Gynuella sunshinyii YC6258]